MVVVCLFVQCICLFVCMLLVGIFWCVVRTFISVNEYTLYVWACVDVCMFVSVKYFYKIVLPIFYYGVQIVFPLFLLVFFYNIFLQVLVVKWNCCCSLPLLFDFSDSLNAAVYYKHNNNKNKSYKLWLKFRGGHQHMLI